MVMFHHCKRTPCPICRPDDFKRYRQFEVVVSEDETAIFGGLIKSAAERWRAVLSMKGAQE